MMTVKLANGEDQTVGATSYVVMYQDKIPVIQEDVRRGGFIDGYGDALKRVGALLDIDDVIQELVLRGAL